jgi:hypothetical protein
MKWTFFAGVALSLLTGCVTSEQRIAQDDTQCLSYGVPKGSPAYVQCRMKLDENRANLQAAASFGNSGGLIGFIERQTQ